ncbi:hypothetical protein SynA18461_00622 [Synechococcus sp. A18-46.1]|nr:hypothetical protein SynA18461_00622 [Synechococcus sp. A18-46.1]
MPSDRMSSYCREFCRLPVVDGSAVLRHGHHAGNPLQRLR